MSDVGDAMDEVREELAGASEEFMPDICSITKKSFTDGGGTGDTMAPTAGATDIPCSYKPLGQRSMVVTGGEAYLASHRLTLPATDDTVAIDPEDLITVEARGSHPTLVFQKPVVIDGSYSVFVSVAATLVQQGYQQ